VRCRTNQGVNDLVDRLARRQRSAQIGTSLLKSRHTVAVTASGELDGDRREPALRHIKSPPDQTGMHLADTVGMTHQDQRCWFGGGRPQDAEDLAQSEFAFDGAALDNAFRDVVHGRAFREC
jgi:hypothetical protein